MVTALVLLLTACLVQGALGGQFEVSLPQTIDVLKGSCVTIPCSFDIEDKYESDLDNTCRVKWYKGSFEEPAVFDSSGAQGTIQGNLNGVLKSKDCTTTLNNMTPQYNDTYHFRLQCNNGLRYNFGKQQVQISVGDNLQRPTLTPSTLKVREGSSVSLTCSAPAPCVSLPPTLTWTLGLGESQETLQENQDKTKVKMSVVSFTASHLHNGLEMSCTAVYRKQDGSTESSVKSSLRADVTYSPKDTTVSVSPSGPVKEDTDVNLTCSSNANPAVRNYTWHRADGDQEFVTRTGRVFKFKASRDSGPVFCKAENEVGAGRSNATQIDVQYSPKDTRVSVSPSGPVKEDTDVNLTCSSNANPAVRNYTWHRADEDQEFVIRTGRVYKFKASRDSGQVFCKAENEVGAGQSKATQIDVQYSPKDTTVSVSPSGPVKEDTDVNLTCSSNANPAVRNYTWYRADGDQEFVIRTGRVYKFKASRDSGPVFCKAENEVGAGRSNVTQIDVQYPPQILSSSCTKTVDQLNCSCNTSGNPAPTLHWHMDGSPASNSDSFAVKYEPKEGTSVGFIAVSQTQWKDQFTMLCSSQNSLGSATQQFYFFFEPQGSRDSAISPIWIGSVVALLVLVCALLLVIRALRSNHNLLKSQCSGNTSTIAMSQLVPNGEGNEVVKSKDEDIYVNTLELKEANITKPATPTGPKSPGMPSSGANNTEGARNSSGETNTESKDVIYSTVTWRSKKKQKEEDGNTNQKECTEERLSRDFMNKAVEMGNLYEVEPRNVKGQTECEYAQVKFK